MSPETRSSVMVPAAPDGTEVALVDQPSAAVGTVLRAETVRDFALEAGYADVDVLPVENEFFRLYRLHR